MLMMTAVQNKRQVLFCLQSAAKSQLAQARRISEALNPTRLKGILLENKEEELGRSDGV